MNNDSSIQKIREWLYYILVGVISIVMLVFMPMLGTTAGLQWVLPTTTAGWIVYVISKLCSAGFNISLFHCFNKQGKLNIQHNPNYIEARKLLKQYDHQESSPRSPHEYHKDIYGKKGLTIFLTTLLGTVGLSQAILTFDGKEFLVQLIALILGLIMGILQMKDTETFWTEEYLEYAKDWADHQEKIKAKEHTAQQEKTSLEQPQIVCEYKDITDNTNTCST